MHPGRRRISSDPFEYPCTAADAFPTTAHCPGCPSISIYVGFSTSNTKPKLQCLESALLHLGSHGGCTGSVLPRGLLQSLLAVHGAQRRSSPSRAAHGFTDNLKNWHSRHRGMQHGLSLLPKSIAHSFLSTIHFGCYAQAVLPGTLTILPSAQVRVPFTSIAIIYFLATWSRSNSTQGITSITSPEMATRRSTTPPRRHL